jgi:formylglycine-generating enzyme required for sulfatase activity
VSSILLTEIAPGRWRLSLTPTTTTYTAETGHRLRYAGRSRRADQDWTKFPVSGVSYEDAVAFAGWLDRTRRIPGARLCDEYEWERAARGADARTFPSGGELGPDDANIDVTYRKDPNAFGPDEVGAHPASRSPFAVDDLVGNVFEWTTASFGPLEGVLRGGGYYHGSRTVRSTNRWSPELTVRDPTIGVRICADVPF